jgi:hypothetical protein
MEIKQAVMLLKTAENERTACEVKEAADRKIRDDFQREHPHYMPPPWGGRDAWSRWERANMELHGEEGFCERFPFYVRDAEDLWDRLKGIIA